MSSQFGKEELVHLHLLLFQVKKTLEWFGVDNEYFAAYDSLGISPVHIFRQKDEHKQAIINLCLGIMKAVGKEREVEELCRRIKKVAMEVQH